MKIAFESLSFVLGVYIDYGLEVQMVTLRYCGDKKDKRRSFPREEKYDFIWEEEARRQGERRRRNKRRTIIERQDQDVCN